LVGWFPSRIPKIQEEVEKVLWQEAFKGVNPDEVVAIGAAFKVVY